MKNRSPLMTLCAVAAAAAAIWLVDGSHESGAAAPPAIQVAAPATIAPTATPAPTAPRKVPRKMHYRSEIPTGAGTLALDIYVDGDRARAYACDNQGIEVWLRGHAADGIVSLANIDGTARLHGQLSATLLRGTLSVDDKQWAFHADPVRGIDA